MFRLLEHFKICLLQKNAQIPFLTFSNVDISLAHQTITWMVGIFRQGRWKLVNKSMLSSDPFETFHVLCCKWISTIFLG